MMHSFNIPLVRIAVLGTQHAGKSAYIKRFLGNNFSDSRESIDLCLMHYIRTSDNHDQLTSIMEVSEKTHSSRAADIIRTANAFFVLYTYNDMKSLKRAIKICKHIQKIKDCKDTPLVLVGNKRDSPGDNGAKMKRRSKLVEKELDCFHVDASAKSDLNVAPVFDYVVDIARTHIKRNLLKQMLSSR